VAVFQLRSHHVPQYILHSSITQHKWVQLCWAAVMVGVKEEVRLWRIKSNTFCVGRRSWWMVGSINTGLTMQQAYWFSPKPQALQNPNHCVSCEKKRFFSLNIVYISLSGIRNLEPELTSRKLSNPDAGRVNNRDSLKRAGPLTTPPQLLTGWKWECVAWVQ